jgi:F0F1-type ATP synthase assembly protein I
MLYLIIKALLSGVIIMAASETAKRSPAYGALLVSLPLILAMICLWRDTGPNCSPSLNGETSGVSRSITPRCPMDSAST